MTLLKLASYLKGKYDNYQYSCEEVSGFLCGLEYCKKITESNSIDIYNYICRNYSNQTEQDEIRAKLKKKLEKIKIK